MGKTSSSSRPVIVSEAYPARGEALDLSCGTGINVRTLVEHWWEADGVDFLAYAIETAQAKLPAFPAESYVLFCGNFSRLEGIPAPRAV